MTFDIEVGDRAFTVSVERADAPHRYRLRLDGEVRLVDAVSVGSGVWSVIDVATGRALAVTAALGPSGEGVVRVGSDAVPVAVNGRRTRHAGDPQSSGEQRLLAPMPGKVLRVLVRPGDAVALRQPLVVIEAMKMENELTAARAGVVRAVDVAEGASVEAGRLLVVVGDPG
jgi:biotin carboxyl carrier protein